VRTASSETGMASTGPTLDCFRLLATSTDRWTYGPGYRPKPWCTGKQLLSGFNPCVLRSVITGTAVSRNCNWECCVARLVRPKGHGKRHACFPVASKPKATSLKFQASSLTWLWDMIGWI